MSATIAALLALIVAMQSFRAAPSVARRPEPHPARAEPILPIAVMARTAGVPLEDTGRNSLVSDFLARVRSGLVEALKNDPDYQQYLSCVAQSSRKQCLSLLSDAVYAAMAVGTSGCFEKHSTEDLFQAAGEEAFWRTLDEDVLSPDELTRISALLLLRRTTDIEARSLPSEEYRDLADKTDPEVQLLLQEHGVTGLSLPDSSARAEAYAIASDTNESARVRMSATEALGHAEDSDAVDRLVTAAVSDTTFDPVTVTSLPFALGRCGIACDATLRRLAASGAASDRALAYRALWFMSNATIQQNYEQEFRGMTPATLDQFSTELENSKTELLPTG